MRVAVLCVLAFAGATCALQLPSIPSVINEGSSILNNLPGNNQNSDESSSSSSGSSSQEDRNTPEIATELAERLVNDVWNAGSGIGSAALLPIEVGASLFNTLTNEISDFLGNLHLENLVDSAIPELAAELTGSVVRDIESVARNLGSLLLEPEKVKANLVKTIAGDISQFIDKIQDQLSGSNSGEPKHRHPTHRPRPSTTHRPRPTPPNHPRPSSTPRPRPTPSKGPRPTHPTRPSTPRPSPTPSKGPRPTPPAQPSTPRPTPTPSGGSQASSSARPSSARPRPSGHSSSEKST